MYCVSCGKELPGEAVFCPICGKKQPIVDHAETQSYSAAALPDAQPVPIQSANGVTIRLPTGDMEPTYFLEKATWQFRYRDGTVLPGWFLNPIDVLVSDDYIFIISNDDSTNWRDRLGFYAQVAGVITAGAVPVVGIAAGLAGMAAGSLFGKKAKKPDYGRNSQFAREALFQAIEVGRCFWTQKNGCEFSAYRYRESFTINVNHCFSIAGQFHTNTNDVTLSAYRNMGFNDGIGCLGDRIKKGMQSMGKCALKQDLKVRNEDEVISIMTQQYPNCLKH